jgi:rod shape-determining protein MreC
LDFLEHADKIQPGDRVVTSGDGEVFPAGLLVGSVVLGNDKRLRVVLAADYQRLEFLRVLRSHRTEPITDAGALLAPEPPKPLPPGYQGPPWPGPQSVAGGNG